MNIKPRTSTYTYRGEQQINGQIRNRPSRQKIDSLKDKASVGLKIRLVIRHTFEIK